MKTLKFIVLLSLCRIVSYSQILYEPIKKGNLQTIEKNIVRIVFSKPLSQNRETNFLAFNLENRLKQNISISIKAGVGIGIKDFGTNGNKYQTSFHGYGSLEGKYYFLINNFKKKGKYIYNFSNPYLSIEQNIFTNQFALINQIPKESFEGATATFLNLGYQGQVKKLFASVFFGVQLQYNDFAKYDKNRSLESIHGGACIGYVF